MACGSFPSRPSAVTIVMLIIIIYLEEPTLFNGHIFNRSYNFTWPDGYIFMYFYTTWFYFEKLLIRCYPMKKQVKWKTRSRKKKVRYLFLYSLWCWYFALQPLFQVRLPFHFTPSSVKLSIPCYPKFFKKIMEKNRKSCSGRDWTICSSIFNFLWHRKIISDRS